MRVDGYWFNDEGVLNLFAADFDSRNELESLTRTDVDAAFKRITNFFEASINRGLAGELEVTSPEYGLAKQIADRKSTIHQINLFLFSERTLSERIQDIPDSQVAGIPTSHHIWDISRLHRQKSSRSHKEALDLDFKQIFGKGIPCLPAHLGTDAYQSYLVVMPAGILATLYEKFGARLLEQNVRTFLQARGNVNRGIRATILNEPGMFFAYNNGITATAQSVETETTDTGLSITEIVDLQIVNGGQTTASLFHTQKQDKADLSHIFVQMKLSVITDSLQSETVVPKISEYANTQNRVNAADFFSNHPFHVRMEEFSRRIWAPAQQGSQRETKWFYERARGQYADAQSKLTPGEQRRFKAEHPKPQMFTKTDLAKFENVWDDHPRWVNLGSQKNFARYAARIGSEWEKSPDRFNEFYFKCAVARGLIFRAAERIVSAQPWYNGGYRANIVAYTLAVLSEITKRKKACIDFIGIWNSQHIDTILEKTIIVVSREVNEDITSPSLVSNISEWCKKEACWTRIQECIENIEKHLPSEFYDRLLSFDDQAAETRTARQTQKIDNGIEVQRHALAIPAEKWSLVHKTLLEKGLLTEKELGVLKIAMQIPAKIPNGKQCVVLLALLKRSREEGLVVDGST
ncbi:hypothetical protein AGMMS49545_22710 [Betaproteobacteria bacterium]|nr:hypothetical protein AGMMS49545_22710 [Betaproteobacteria bacterium]